MPIYEYQCNECGHHFEKIQKVSDAPLTDCPACQKSTLKKLVSAAGFQLKGTGWYVTDFRNKGKPEDKATDSSKPDTSSGSDTKETKKETKTDSSGASS